MAHTLPPELWQKITSLTSSPRRTASVLSLTSRTLMHLTRPLLFSSLTIDLSNPFRAFHRLRSLLEPSYDRLSFDRPIWGGENPLWSVKRFEVRDCEEGCQAVGGGEEGWMRFDMYKAPVDEDGDEDAGVRGLFGSSSRSLHPILTSASTQSPSSKHDTDHSPDAHRRSFVLSYALSNLTHTLIKFPALQSFSLSFALEPISYTTLDSSFKGWLYGRLIHGKLQSVSFRGIRDIELELSAALLGAEEVVIADCTFSAEGMDLSNKRDALNLAMYKGVARSRSRIRKLTFESPHSIDASTTNSTGKRKRRSTLAVHWEFIGINRSIASTVHTLDVSITSYNPRSLSSAASLVQLLSSSPSGSKKSGLRSLTINTSPLHLSHLSFQPPPDPSLPTSRVLFFPSGSQMLTEHGSEGNDHMCWLNKIEFNMWDVGSRDWRDTTLLVKQWAGMGSASTSPGPSSSRGVIRRTAKDDLGSDIVADADADLDFSSPEMWFQRYMRDAGFLPPFSSSLSIPAPHSAPFSSSPLPIRKFLFPSLSFLSFHISFWLNTPTSSNGEFGFVLSYLSALSRAYEAASALEEVNLRVKVGAGDCIDNFKIWSGSPGSSCPAHLTFPSFPSSSSSSPYSSHSSLLLQSPTFPALGHTLSSPSFTHLARVNVVLESRIGCQWGIEGVRGVVEGVCGGVRGGVERGLNEGRRGEGVGVEVGFRLI